MGAAGSIAGAVSRNNQISKRTEAIDKRLRENQNWYDRRYNEDATQRADAQRLLTMTEDAIRRRNRAAEGRKAVMGGTDESVAAEKEANNMAYANAVSQIAAVGERRKDVIEQQYRNKKESYEDMRDNLESQRASGLDMLGGAVGGAVSGMKAFLDASKKKEKKKEEKKEEDAS